MRNIEAITHKSKIRKLFLLVAAYCFLLTVFYGCASSQQEIKREESKRKVAIERVSLIEDGNGVLIEASGPVTYTAFKLSDPTRLVLDIPSVDMEKVKGTMEVNNNFINTITVASYGEKTITPIVRVEIGLKEGLNYEVKLGEGSITVSLNHEAAPQKEAPAATEAPPQAEPPKQEIAKQEEPSKAVVEETITSPPAAVEEKEAKKADRLLRIEARKEDGGTIIRIIGNGAIGDFNAFAIDKPARLVVDVWNVKSSISKNSLNINSSQIKRARIGEHPNKVRLVFDSNKKALPPYTIERVEESLVITTGRVAAAKPETVATPVTTMPTTSITPTTTGEAYAPGPSAMPAAEPKRADNAEIKSVDFKQLTDKARLVVTASKKIEYQLSKSADEVNLVLDIKNATIAEELRRTLDTSDLNTPVASISSFQAPAELTKTARILVKLKEKTAYNISQEEERIEMDFPLLAAAQAVPKEAETKPVEEVSASKKVSAQEIKPTGEVAKREEGIYTGRKISLDFKDADISNILRLMAEISNLNIIAGEDVKGKVSLRLVDVPWDQAFDIILKTNGLGKVQEGNVVRIMPLSKIKQENEELLASRKAKEKLEDLEIKLFSVSYAKASELEPQVKSLLSDRGSVTVEARTNTLIIKDIPANIAKAVDLVKKLDTQTPQVLIEGRIIEAQSNFARDLGVQWGAATATRSPDSFNSSFGSTSTSPPQTLTPTGFIGSGGRFSAQPTYAVSLPAAGTAGALGAMGFSFGTLTGDPFLLDLRISAGEKNGLTKTISRPRITTLDNKEAKISQGDSVPFETTSSSGTQTQFIDATLELTVTPHITPDGSVSMKIKASRNSIGSFRSAAGTPSISKKEASTEIIVKDGETAVIGGIVVADKSDTSSGIPFFKDIPFLGWLFKNKSTADSQTELLIFITPNIVKGKVEL
ncbi:MAG: type IV pilus secretin PilQ [Deltaproteobacteria bacterium]|nr:type IV pilus secretin PilQ [Deltaproteobacteria bacterium]